MRLEAEFEEIEEDAFFEFGLAILVYLDNDGNQRYGIKVLGEANVATVVGLMEMSKRKLLEGT